MALGEMTCIPCTCQARGDGLERYTFYSGKNPVVSERIVTLQSCILPYNFFSTAINIKRPKLKSSQTFAQTHKTYLNQKSF